jgi:hypothetical protein
MKIQERSYSGNLFRPRPEVHLDSSGQLLIVATPWGPRSSAKKVVQLIIDHFNSSRDDNEATSPFSRLTCLSVLANHLRTAVKLANDLIYNEDNKNEYMSGIELFVMAKSGSEICWIQTGMPCPILDRTNSPLAQLGSSQDLALEFSRSTQLLAPLPSKLLGVDITSDFATESIHPTMHDRFIILSRSGSNAEVLRLAPGDRSIESISRILSTEDPELPFWLGIVEI